MQSINQITVVGAGAMGTGIAQVAASAGHEVIVFDSKENALAASRQSMDDTMSMLVQKGKKDTEWSDSLKSRIKWTNNLYDLTASDLLIEAVIEDLEIKKDLFSQLEKVVPAHSILTTNTSSLSVTELASALSRPERFAGLHFFNPAPVMKLVEIIPPLQYDPHIISKLTKLMLSWSKVPVLAKDTPGFIVNRIARPYYGEALRIADEGLASMEQIDTAMRELGGFKMGPFELMDFIGHDVNYRVTESVYAATYYDPRYRPSITQKRLLDAGWLGRKSGKGFYTYPRESTTIQGDPGDVMHMIYDRITAMQVNEAGEAVYFGICTEKDADNAMIFGAGYPEGPLARGRRIGLDQILKTLEALYIKYREERYRPGQFLQS